jgi:hypothetical protein
MAANDLIDGQRIELEAYLTQTKNELEHKHDAIGIFFSF